jgi:hypothetical protein
VIRACNKRNAARVTLQGNLRAQFAHFEWFPTGTTCPLTLSYFLSLAPVNGSGLGVAAVTEPAADELAPETPGKEETPGNEDTPASATGNFANGSRFLVRAALASRYAWISSGVGIGFEGGSEFDIAYRAAT